MDNKASRTLRTGETTLKNYGNPEGRIGTESGEDLICARLRRITTEHGILWRSSPTSVPTCLRRAQQSLFAYVDTLAKALLTCVPEPPADARPRAVEFAKERSERLIKSARARHGR